MDFEKFTVDLNARCVCGCMEGDRIHKIYRFPNDYGASVVSGPKADPDARGKFRMFVLHYESDPPENAYDIDRDTLITDDFLTCNDWDEVEVQLQRVYDLERQEHSSCSHRGL